ncbi:FxsA family protein [Nocardia asiatica]|uniref:FxsA family protein n=1 Tax=Nocardia asiatica TaxID=209252 RepID=UPI002456022E|nr:FxsA family protein [Nocardia asiatica]
MARRLMIHASEDIGMADPMALQTATAAAQVVQLVGLPEGRLALARGGGGGLGPPGAAVADGALVAAGGVLMFVPGLVTSLFGLLLLLPPTRSLLRPLVTAFAARRLRRLAAAAPYRGVVVDASEVVDGVVVGQWYDDGRGTARRAITPS